MDHNKPIVKMSFIYQKFMLENYTVVIVIKLSGNVVWNKMLSANSHLLS